MFLPGYGYPQSFTFLVANGGPDAIMCEAGETGRQRSRQAKQRRDHKRYLTELEVSEITGRSLSTLRKDRHYGRGIPYSKLGRQVRYSREDVDQYMAACRIKTRCL